MWCFAFPALKKDTNIRSFDGETCFSVLDYHAAKCIVHFRKNCLEQRMIRIKIKSAFPTVLNEFVENIVLSSKNHGEKKLDAKKKIAQFRDASYKSQKSSKVFEKIWL